MLAESVAGVPGLIPSNFVGIDARSERRARQSGQRATARAVDPAARASALSRSLRANATAWTAALPIRPASRAVQIYIELPTSEMISLI